MNLQTKLWNRDFILLVFGQTVSIFGNMILSFALPLFILDISDSPALYGLVLALPYISLILTSPIGGILADRLRKQRIMFWLDAITTLIIVLYMITSGLLTAVVPIVIIKLMALNAIQGMYMPTVQATVPLLSPEKNLVTANSVVTTVNMLSSMAGMAIAGLLYAEFGLFPILVVSAIAFAITAVMDLLIRIPYKKQESTGSVIQIAKNDLSLSAKFMFKEKKILAICAFIAFLMSISFASVIMVGIPVLIMRNLEMDASFVGISQSVMMVGGLLGSIAAGAIGAKLTIKKLPPLLGVAGVLLAGVGLPFLLGLPHMAAYVIITVSAALAMGVVQMSNIPLFAFVQTEAPNELLGKVMSLIIILPFIANGIGSLIYGLLFEWFEGTPYIVVFATVVVSVMIAMYAHRQFKKI
jgi:MFS family permease